LASYIASKVWVITATRAAAVELAPQSIRVNALNAVADETPLLATFMGEDTPEMRAKFLSTIPLRRFSTPEDLGNAVCYLCDEASMVTGVRMELDGGGASELTPSPDFAPFSIRATGMMEARQEPGA
jgi:3-oxoacyl-[acyl-carrier protein] reductase